MRMNTLVFYLICLANLMIGSLTSVRAQTASASMPASNQTTTTTTLTRMQRLFPNNEAMKHGPLSDSVRASRAAHLFVRYGDKPEIREAAVWFLNKFAQEKHPYDYWGAAGMAIIRLHEQAKKEGLIEDEKAALRQVIGQNNSQSSSRIDTVAAMVLLEDSLRGLSEKEKLPEYEKFIANDIGNRGNAFLIVRHYQVPTSLQRYWNGGPRFAKTGRPSYEGMAGQWYYRYGDMKFVSSEAEMQFLFGRIQECYATIVLKPDLPEPYGELRFQEAFAATARLIEMGDVVVPFLLKQEEFIMSAYGADEAHDKVGFNFELEVIRANRNAAFKPLLRRLVRSANKNTHYWAAQALDAIERDKPSDFVPHYVFYFDPPNGI